MNEYRVTITYSNAYGEHEGDETQTETHWIAAKNEAMAAFLVGCEVNQTTLAGVTIVNVSAVIETN